MVTSTPRYEGPDTLVVLVDEFSRRFGESRAGISKRFCQVAGHMRRWCKRWQGSRHISEGHDAVSCTLMAGGMHTADTCAHSSPGNRRQSKSPAKPVLRVWGLGFRRATSKSKSEIANRSSRSITCCSTVHETLGKNNHLTEMCSGSEAGSYSRRIDVCISQLKAQRPSRTCHESQEEEKS